ncbi:VWA domain-containing protein [Afifella sp. JA880]|uniref:vWA domain-containing protein n=1 Tax=Afifella sp. JA880 TaxID=2975280 RepID=UPI0021BAC1BD|nr:VWA domain-containing protein [Afifella sp. JA880]MCT8267300.1 VWA domain-containing protein [Afifella sp. JA880]
MTETGGKIADNIVYFARALRRAGLPVGPAAVVDAIRAVEVAGISSRDDFYWTLHAVFVNKRADRPVFHEAFELFWRERGLVEKMLELLSPVAPPRPAQTGKPKPGQQRVEEAMQALKERREEEVFPEIEIDARMTVSEKEILRRKDFAQMSAEEIASAMRALASLQFPDDQIVTRRLVAATRGKVDPRRTVRATMRSAGDLILPQARKRKVQEPPLVALADISGSMSEYSRVMLHFLHALSSRRKVHSFLFGTRLSNVTRQLRYKDPDEALAGCSEAVVDWSGGTRIADALHVFNRDWSRRVLGQGATVLLITDGLEREEGADLGAEAARLGRSCRRLIWLNPLLRFEQFEAKARGIRAILPHVDDFRPVHSLGAIEDLVKALSTPAKRPRPALSRAA